MSSIAELLKEFSTESSQTGIEENNLVEGQIGTDETTTELEEAIEEVAEAVSDQEQVAAGTDVLLDAVESLESAVAMIQDARLQGQRINGTAMRIWANGVADSMEARQIPAVVYEDLISSFGDSFESDTYTDYSTEAEEKAEGIFTKIWNMIKSAFARARDFLARLIGWFGKSAESIIKAGHKLRAAVKDKKELKTPGAKVRSAAYSDLLGGTLVSPIDTVSNGKERFEEADELATQMYEEAVSMANALKSGTVPVPKEDLGNKYKKVNTGYLAGREITTSEKQGTSWYNDGKFSIKLKVAKSKRNAPAESAPMSISAINLLADRLIELGELVKSRSNDAKRTQGKLKVDFPKDEKGKHEIQKMSERRKAARIISSLTAAASSMRGQMASIVLSGAKKAYVYGMANVRMYK